jgi:S1-C subfamily serine protease
MIRAPEVDGMGCGSGYRSGNEMIRKTILLALACVAATASGAMAKETAAPVPAATDPKAEALAVALAVEESLVKSIAAVRENSVAVMQLRKDKSDTLRMAGQGSGVVLMRGKPYVLTNEHVIKGADAIEVRTIDGTTYTMKQKDHLPQYDIALLEFTGPKPKGIKGAKIGKSRDLSEGQWVVATGNPFFLGTDGQAVVTVGVVSGLDRTLPGEFNYPNAIQHDAEVNPGNSGGPLWNLDGELVGINGKIATRSAEGLAPSNTGASFSIPIHLVEAYLGALLNDKAPTAAGYTGLTFETKTDPKGNPIGALVKRVAADCPCIKSIGVGDVLVKIGVAGRDYDVRSASDYENVIALVPAGTKVRLVYVRDGKQKLTWSGELTAQK